MSIKQKHIYPVLMAIAILAFYWYEQHGAGKEVVTPTLNAVSTNDFYLPYSTTGAVIHHQFYSLSYSELHEQAEWVAYELKKKHLSNANRERPYFNEDLKVVTGSANWRNYKNSGYDRGHLCAAGDRRFSVEAYNETFFTSNISPMERSFNSGIWNRLEQQTRYWANKYDGVFVVTGGVLKNSHTTIGLEKVTVPSYFYKILLDNRQGTYKLIAFLIPHEQRNDQLQDFVVTVDYVEQLTGIDFFPKLPDTQEDLAEATVNLNDWSF